jgi:hypothetical protein
MNTETAFQNLRACCDEAPAGTYEQAKQIRQAISDAMQDGLRALGLKNDNCDIAHACEAAMYEYVKRCNPNTDALIVAEGFGSAVNGPARERVIEQASRNRDAFNRLTGRA